MLKWFLLVQMFAMCDVLGFVGGVTYPRVTLLCPHVTLSHRARIVPLSRGVTCLGLLNICSCLYDITTGADLLVKKGISFNRRFGFLMNWSKVQR